MTLEPLRDRIDRIDEDLIRLLIERAETALEIGRTKKTAGRPVRDPSREEAILSKIRSLSRPPLTRDDAERIYRVIMDVSSDIQART